MGGEETYGVGRGSSRGLCSQLSLNLTKGCPDLQAPAVPAALHTKRFSRRSSTEGVPTSPRSVSLVCVVRAYVRACLTLANRLSPRVTRVSLRLARPLSPCSGTRSFILRVNNNQSDASVLIGWVGAAEGGIGRRTGRQTSTQCSAAASSTYLHTAIRFCVG